MSGEKPTVEFAAFRTAAVAAWLERNARRPREARLLWAGLLRSVSGESGEIGMPLERIAEIVGIEPDEALEIVAGLEGIRAVSSKEADGGVRYFVNPWCATLLEGEARERALAETEPPAVELKPPAPKASG